MAWEGDYLLDYSCSGCLLDNIPGEMELRQTLGDIDENLKQNAVCIEQTMRELQSDLSKMCIGEKLQNTGDCLQWLSSYNISCVKPFTTPCDQLTSFLKAVLHFLKTEECPEEMIMQLLLDLSAECGVVFPLNSCGASFHVPSTTSVHSIEFNDSLDALSVWDDVRLHLRRFLVDKLQNCQGMNNTLPNIQFKAQCLQQLLFLYPETEVLTKYQSIQCKSVQDLLQSNILTNIDEISFDKVAHGFENMIPVVCTMMRQDLYALRTLVEGTKVLEFINDAYLLNIAEELYIFTEKLCAQQLRKNVQHLAKTNKSLNKQKGAVQFVAPQEQTKEVRNMRLTAHQLRCLSQLMKILLHFEKRMEELTSEVFLGNFPMQHGRNVRGVLKKTLANIDVPSEMNKAHIQAEQLLLVTEPVSLECDWRNAFKGLASSIAHCVKMVIEDTCSGCLQQETNQYTSSKSLATCTHQVKTTWDLYMEEEQPKKIAKFCSDIMEGLDMLLPLALASSESFLQEIRENFLDGCSKVAVDILSRLEERSKEVPSKIPVQNLYVILSTAIFIHNCLTAYENLLKESNINRPLFLLQIQRYQEFIRVIQFQVTNYCIKVCATSIFQDAQSHHWDDAKSFYEGERCSFSIQMWYYYCCALRYDLWMVLPSRLAQELLAEVLSEFLTILACRYSQSCPTYNRTSQIRIDITAILMCTENLLWSVCRSTQELLQPSEDMSRWIFTIHNNCNALLTVLTVLTSPLDKLYEVFCNGFSEYNSTLPLESVNRGLLGWLHWIRLSCFSNELHSSSSCDKVAVKQHLMLLLSQPNCNWNLLLQMLMLQDCLVPRILLNSTFIDQENFADVRTKGKNSDEQSKLIEAIVMVMTYSKSLPRCLSIVLEDYMDKYQLWNQLCYLSDKSEVLRCLNHYISNASKTILKQVISLVLMWQAVEHPVTYHHKQMLPESLLSKIPKEWDYIPREFKRRETGKNLTELIAQAVSVVIGNLPAAIASLPSTIKYLFNLAETKLHNIPKLQKSCLLCYVMTICQTLEDGNAVELLTSVTIDRWSKDKLGLLSECLQSIMGQQKESPKPIIQKVINCLEKQKPKWIDAQLRKARELCTEHTFLTDEGCFAQEKDSFAELTKQKISMILMDICHQPGGSEYLRQIYHVIQLNEDWLKEQIYFQHFSDVKGVPPKPYQLTLHGFPQPLVFNPLHAFNHIGSSNFNQSAITEWNWDWSKVLHSNLGLSQLTFRALLANRWEMQAEATLEAKEKNMIEHLQKMYFSKDK
ncbi:uncharacterized protein KIAA0825 homolog [Mustelus asterias]